MFSTLSKSYNKKSKLCTVMEFSEHKQELLKFRSLFFFNLCSIDVSTHGKNDNRSYIPNVRQHLHAS